MVDAQPWGSKSGLITNNRSGDIFPYSQEPHQQNQVTKIMYQLISPGPSSIENDAPDIEKLLLKAQVNEKFLNSDVNLIILYINLFHEWI